MSKKATADSSFEQNIAELEAIVQKLEHGELALDDALQQFERGVGLARLSQQQLQQAEQKVQILLQQGSGEQLQPYES
ncbi:MAG TPA: exodeoxyribonuclease VII small subunit [Rheinheimera sp.]|nr:exodeoxyribonuclease VII small subunit [Rheinheimera sp.]